MTILRDRIAAQLGATSFVLLIVQLFCAFVVVTLGFSVESSTRGFPSGSDVGLAYALILVMFVAPPAFLFGLFGILHRAGKWSLFGMLGNLTLMVTAQWAEYALLGNH